MNKTQSPCLTCTRVKNPGSCENKTCRVWSEWFLTRWGYIHDFYKACADKKGEEDELEK